MLYKLSLYLIRLNSNVFHHQVADPIKWPEISWQPTPQLLRAMSQQNNVQSIQQEGRIEVALQALQSKQF